MLKCKIQKLKTDLWNTSDLHAKIVSGRFKLDECKKKYPTSTINNVDDCQSIELNNALLISSQLDGLFVLYKTFPASQKTDVNNKKFNDMLRSYKDITKTCIRNTRTYTDNDKNANPFIRQSINNMKKYFQENFNKEYTV